MSSLVKYSKVLKDMMTYIVQFGIAIVLYSLALLFCLIELLSTERFYFIVL